MHLIVAPVVVTLRKVEMGERKASIAYFVRKSVDMGVCKKHIKYFYYLMNVQNLKFLWFYLIFSNELLLEVGDFDDFG